MEKSRDALLDVAAAETWPDCQENHLTHEDMDLVLEEPLDNQAGKVCKTDIGLQRDKGEGPLGEDEELQDGDLSAGERRFLEEFPRWKQDQEEVIRKVRTLADRVDATHKTATKTKVVANSAAAISGVLSLLGLALAPATAGGSLLLTAAGQGLGAAAGVASIVTDVLENSRNKKARAQASSLVPTSDQEFKEAGGEKTAYVTAAGKIVYNCGNAFEIVRKNARAFRVARARPHLATAAKRLLTSGQVSARSSRQVQKAFEGTALTMTRNARVLGGAMAAISLGHDLYALSEDCKQLKDGARAELAEELRTQARELEEVVTECTHYYNRLRQKLLQEKRQMSSSLRGATETQPQPPSQGTGEVMAN